MLTGGGACCRCAERGYRSNQSHHEYHSYGCVVAPNIISTRLRLLYIEFVFIQLITNGFGQYAHPNRFYN